MGVKDFLNTQKNVEKPLPLFNKKDRENIVKDLFRLM